MGKSLLSKHFAHAVKKENEEFQNNDTLYRRNHPISTVIKSSREDQYLRLLASRSILALCGLGVDFWHPFQANVYLIGYFNVHCF